MVVQERDNRMSEIFAFAYRGTRSQVLGRRAYLQDNQDGTTTLTLRHENMPQDCKISGYTRVVAEKAAAEWLKGGRGVPLNRTVAQVLTAFEDGGEGEQAVLAWWVGYIQERQMYLPGLESLVQNQ